MEVKIDYSPRPWAEEFHEDKHRWKILVLHRRAGKTIACLNHLQRDATTIGNSRFGYIAPTYKQAKNVAWDYMKRFARPIPGTKFNEAELRVDYPNGSRITLFGADNPDSLRGVALWGVVFDEYSQQPSNIFSEIIRPALADNKGYGIWIGTPKGKNDFWRLYDEASNDPDWYAVKLGAAESRLIDIDELIDAKKQMSEDEYLQEFECSFEASIKGAYYAQQLSKAREDGRITDVPYDPYLKVHTWWDLGVADSTVILFFQNHGPQWRMIDVYEQSGEGLSHYLEVLKKKKYNYGEHFAPHDIKVRELGSGKSRYEQARNIGLKFNVVKNLPVEDGINAVRERFGSLWIDEVKCRPFLDAIVLYRKEWDDKKGMFKPRPVHDFTSHFAHALRYWGVSKEVSSEGLKSFKPFWKGYSRL